MALTTHWYFLVLPLVVLAVMSLLRFRGCQFNPAPAQADQYGVAVAADSPTTWFRLEDTSQPTAKNEEGPPDGAYGTATSPLSAGDPGWHSSAVPDTSLTLAINNPKLIPLETQDPFDFSVNFQGSFVQVPASDTALQDLTEFTVEALVFANWDLTAQGTYYCVLELAGLVPPAKLKAAGFGLYAGPSDTSNLNTPYSWQVWMGNGNAFQRLEEKKPYNPPDPANTGPNVEFQDVTYLAFTFSKSLGQAFLYLFTQDRDLDYVAYELIPVAYVPVAAATTTQGLHIGATAQGPLFQPPPGAVTPVLYPFLGQMANVAFYTKVLSQDQLRQHAIAAFFIDSPST